jgi:hypothetical protein
MREKSPDTFQRVQLYNVDVSALTKHVSQHTK